MNALSLFSGIGGIDLACEWAGIKTVAMCERESFCQKVLRKHWPDVPIYDDVCTLTKERLDTDGIGTVDIILSGDPCQPYSNSGERQGETDDRFLWPEVNRLLETIRPRWLLRENVAGNITLGLDGVFADLEILGYTCQSFIIPATAVGAFHRRDRVFVVAYSQRGGQQGPRGSIDEMHPTQNKNWKTSGFIDAFQRNALPYVCREHHGIPGKLDESRLKSLGNAVVPQQVYPILAAIKQIDDKIMEGSYGQESNNLNAV